MKSIVSVILVIFGIVHLIPLKGVLGSDWILELYGISWLIGKPNELIGQVVMIDWVATALLFIAGVLQIGVTSLFDHL